MGNGSIRSGPSHRICWWRNRRYRSYRSASQQWQKQIPLRAFRHQGSDVEQFAARLKMFRFATLDEISNFFAQIGPDTKPPELASLDKRARNPLLIRRRFRWAPPRNSAKLERGGRCAHVANRLPFAKLARVLCR